MDLARGSLEPFREAFNEAARDALAPEPAHLRPCIRVELEVDPAGLSLELADRSVYLGPHGMGNPRPAFLARGLSLRGAAREVGTGHLKVVLARNGASVEAIGFGLARRIPPASLGSGPLDAVFQLTINEYRGRRTPQMRLLDLRPAGTAERVEAS